MLRQLTGAISGATALSARVMARAIAVPVDTALWGHETTNRKLPQWHSRNKVVLASPFALLRDFSVGDDDVVPTLLFPPLAGHASCIVDKNEMFKGELKVAGKTVNLRSITCPVFLLGGEEDDTTPWQQVHNMRYAVGSLLVRWYLAPGGHIDLFIGHRSQAKYWTPILAQVRELSRPRGITNATTSTSTRSAGDATFAGCAVPGRV